jgi:hypothetical protein
MNLDIINAYLTERYAGYLSRSVAALESAIAAGEVRNMVYKDAKDSINRAVDHAVDQFEDRAGRSGRFNVLVMGAYNLPAALKEANKLKATARAEFLAALIPLNDLLKAAKPLIVKGKRAPDVEAKAAAKEAERAAHTMTCQCCERQIFAETGVIAHHGYERPSIGWQTASCMGARYQPFEADRTRLGDMIRLLEQHRDRMASHLKETEAERAPISSTFAIGYDRAKHETVSSTIYVNRASFLYARAVVSECSQSASWWKTFDEMKTASVDSQRKAIVSIKEYIGHCQKRFEGWNKTHDFVAGKWIKSEG